MRILARLTPGLQLFDPEKNWGGYRSGKELGGVLLISWVPPFGRQAHPAPRDTRRVAQEPAEGNDAEVHPQILGKG